MSEKIFNDTVAVIRTSGERTLPLCRQLLERQFATGHVYVVSEYPFEATLRKCYEIGLDSGADWMVTLDADVLLRENAISELLSFARAMPREFVQLEGRIYDKVLGKYRQAGHRVYRVSYLRKAIECIPPAGEQIRPEYCTLQRLGSLGHPSRRIPTVVGLHDFEQYYRDLYRKCVVHAKKHTEESGQVIMRCAVHSAADADFLVIRRAIWDGLNASGRVSIDSRIFDERSSEALADLGLAEKLPISLDGGHDYFKRLFEDVLDTPPPMSAYDEFVPPAPAKSRIMRLQSQLRERGVLSTALRLVANRIHKLSELFAR